jgi:hypothetical protein
MIFGDLDEFPSTQQLSNLKQSELKMDLTVYSIETPTYYRYLNLAQSDEKSLTTPISFDCRNAPDINSCRLSSHKPVDGEPGAQYNNYYLKLSHNCNYTSKNLGVITINWFVIWV